MSQAAFVPVVHGAAADRPDEADTLEAAQAVCAALRRSGFGSDVFAVGPDLAGLGLVADRDPVVVFNLVEALAGEASAAPRAAELLERLGLVHTGAGASALRATLSKIASKRLLTARQLPTPVWSNTGRDFAPGGKVIVKSDSEHASLGIDAGSVVEAADAAAEIERRQARFGGNFFAEAFVDGREFNVSLLEGPDGVEVLPVAEIAFVGFGEDRPRIVDYEAKWLANSFAYHNTPRRFDRAPSDEPLRAELSRLALACWRLFGLEGYARVDFRVDRDGQPWILEINSNPCLTPDAGFVAAAERAGLSYDRLIGQIVATALKRARAAA